MIGIDIGKNSFQSWVSIAWRDRAAPEVVSWPACHQAALPDRHGALRWRAPSEPQTHDARLMPAKYVRLLEGSEDDFRDAKALAEAVHADDEVRRNQDRRAINTTLAFLLERGIPCGRDYR